MDSANNAFHVCISKQELLAATQSTWKKAKANISATLKPFTPKPPQEVTEMPSARPMQPLRAANSLGRHVPGKLFSRMLHYRRSWNDVSMAADIETFCLTEHGVCLSLGVVHYLLTGCLFLEHPFALYKSLPYARSTAFYFYLSLASLSRLMFTIFTISA
jgi:hypothetical protein